MAFPSDLEIARGAKLKPIEDIAGKLTFVVSGPKAAYEKAKPYLDMMGVGSSYVGEGELSRIAKICHNVHLGVVIQSLCEITILAETERLPRNLVSVRKDFAPALTDRLEKILLSMNEDYQGRKILKKTDDTTKFDLLPEGEAGLRRRLAEIFQSPKKN